MQAICRTGRPYLEQGIRLRTMGNQNNIWLIPCSPKHFDAEGCFNKYGQIYWKQEGNFKNAKVGDMGFIYCSAPVKAIRYSFVIISINLPYTKAMDVEDEFTLDGFPNRDSSTSTFLLVKLTGETTAPSLSYDSLRQNGLKGSVMSAMRLSQKKYEELYLYIEDNF